MAAEVARILEAPLDIIVVRKLGIPYQPEVAMGAVGERGIRIVDWPLVSMAGVSAAQVEEAIERETLEVRRRSLHFRAGLAPLDLHGREVLIVDDGIATGSTALAAVSVARELGANSVTIAAPVAPAEVVTRLRSEADEVVVLETPELFRSVGQAYIDFDQVEDSAINAILRSRRGPPDRAEARAV